MFYSVLLVGIIVNCGHLLDGSKLMCNRHFPKVRNCHGNICTAILNGATMLSIVW